MNQDAEPKHFDCWQKEFQVAEKSRRKAPVKRTLEYKHDLVEDESCTEIESESMKPNIDIVPFDKCTTCDFESQSEIEILKQTVETLKKENAKLKVESSTLKSEIINLKETCAEVEKSNFSLTNIKIDLKAFKSYTGLTLGMRRANSQLLLMKNTIIVSLDRKNLDQN